MGWRRCHTNGRVAFLGACTCMHGMRGVSTGFHLHGAIIMMAASAATTCLRSCNLQLQLEVRERSAGAPVDGPCW